MYNPTFIGDIELNEETLAHYGVKGMKWRHRRGKLKKGQSAKTTKYREAATNARTNAERAALIGAHARSEYNSAASTPKYFDHIMPGEYLDKYAYSEEGAVQLLKDNPDLYNRNNLIKGRKKKRR